MICAKCDENFGTTTSAGYSYLHKNTFVDFIVTFYGNDTLGEGVEEVQTDPINASATTTRSTLEVIKEEDGLQKLSWIP